MRLKGLILVVTLLISAPLSGCIGYESESVVLSEDEASVETDIFSIHCEEYDGLDRCWKLLIPEGVNSDTPVPLLSLIHI